MFWRAVETLPANVINCITRPEIGQDEQLGYVNYVKYTKLRFSHSLVNFLFDGWQQLVTIPCAPVGDICP